MPPKANGQATLRDMMTLQEKIFDIIQTIRNDMTDLKIKVYAISIGASVAVSILGFILVMIRLQNIIKTTMR